MARFNKGEVITVPFPFSDGLSTKVRPALILHVLEKNELILCKITSTKWNDQYSVSLDSTDFQSKGLPKSSEIRTNHLWTADSTIVLKSNGKLQKTKINEVIDKIIQLLRN
jgi:mRNA interferase MazF